MIGFAEHTFRLEARQKDGATLRDHLESIERQSGLRPEELDGPDLPPELTPIWMDFLELAGRRGAGGFGLSPLTYPDLDAWARLTGRTMMADEVRLLCRLDDCWLASQLEGMKASG